MTTDPSLSDASRDPTPESSASKLPPENPLLKIAWERQGVYSDNAKRYQNRFVLLRTLVAVLSVLVVVLSLLEPLLDNVFLEQMLLLLPIAITALLAFSVKFDRGNNWILLRGNAETLKMEIYYYRTRVGAYKAKVVKGINLPKKLREPKKDRDAILAERIQQISERVKGSSVHHAALNPYEGQSESKWTLGYVILFAKYAVRVVNSSTVWIWQILFRVKESKLKKLPRETADTRCRDLDNPEDYITYRLEDQFNWYRNKSKQLDRQLQFLQGGIYLLGGAGTFIAAREGQIKSWVAVTTAMTGALTNYLEFKRIEASLVGYNQAADALYDIRAWWCSLSPEERTYHEKFERLVISCEETIRSEHMSWLQDMQDKLSQLYGVSDSEDEDTNDSTPFEASQLQKDEEKSGAFEAPKAPLNQ